MKLSKNFVKDYVDIDVDINVFGGFYGSQSDRDKTFGRGCED